MDPTCRVPFGRTALTVTRLGLGSAPLGGLFEPVSDETAHAVVERGYDLGLRMFDTAPLYGYGLAERRIGHVLSQKPRDEFVLSTKVGRLIRAPAQAGAGVDARGRGQFFGTPPLVPVFDYSRDAIVRSFEESLERLGMDRVDVLHIHDPDASMDQALGEALPALVELRERGTIGAVGAGMNYAEPLARFAREGDFDCFLVAGRYTILDQAALAELLPICERKNIAIVIGGVYNSGILANLDKDAARQTFDYEPAQRHWVEKAQRIKAVCDRHDVPLPAAALQFPLAHPAVATVVTGARTVAELEEDFRLMQHPIPGQLWRDLQSEGLLPEEAPVPEQ